MIVGLMNEGRWTLRPLNEKALPKQGSLISEGEAVTELLSFQFKESKAVPSIASREKSDPGPLIRLAYERLQQSICVDYRRKLNEVDVVT